MREHGADTEKSGQRENYHRGRRQRMIYSAAQRGAQAPAQGRPHVARTTPEQLLAGARPDSREWNKKRGQRRQSQNVPHLTGPRQS